MKLFVGLGNPGTKYASNRHNVGFMAVDRIAEEHGFGPWRQKFQGLVAEGRLGGEKVLLLKPQTYMNRSGQSVGEAARFYKLAPEDIVVFHDEIDLAPGKVRFKLGGGHAGHNGLRSIHQHVGADYARVRIGVGHPGRKEAVAGYVLSDFAKADGEWLDKVLSAISRAAPELAAGNGPAFMNAVARELDDRQRQQRRDAGREAPAGKERPPAERNADVATEDTRSPLQRLLDRFR